MKIVRAIADWRFVRFLQFHARREFAAARVGSGAGLVLYSISVRSVSVAGLRVWVYELLAGVPRPAGTGDH
ncbi:hypothetical protein BKA03_001526 [Demequina lutea]|uniref:Uncharacterized protein n=1 Tax=Demequina lutea TaxID=431489 RepID=A0A7Y9Z9R4_9MICO|nr:hypothetical protein [Demequina lutea]